MISNKDLVWKEDKLMLKDQVMFTLYKDGAGKYRLRWPNGDVTKDFYNQTRAKNNAKRIVLEEINGTTEEEPYDAPQSL